MDKQKKSQQRKSGNKPRNNSRVEALRDKAKVQASKRNYQDAFADEEKSKFPIKRDARHCSNDPQWYFKSEDLLKDTASFSFNKPLGTTMFPDDISAWNSIPGLMSITLAPTVGISIDAQSPINLAAQNIYTRVRYKNSGAANYDAPDLMIYYVAMSNLYAAWNWAKRIYGYASEYEATNYYKAWAYAKADNVDLEEVVSNLANYRSYLNMAADRISAFVVPAVFSYMTRQSWLYTNIYKDADTVKAQEYMFTPGYFYTFDEMSSPQGSKLVVLPVNAKYASTPWTTTSIKNLINTMINNLQYSSDIGNMSGDTLKEFGDNRFMLSHFDPDYKVQAVYNREVLTQFENAVWLRSMSLYLGQTNADLSKFDIVHDPNTNYIKFKPSYEVAAGETAPHGYHINFHWNSPTPADVIVATRLNVAWSSKGYVYTVEDCGSEIALGANVIHYTYGEINTPYSTSKAKVLTRTPLQALTFGNSASAAATVENMYGTAMVSAQSLQLWNAFDWAPMLTMTMRAGNAASDANIRMIPLRDWDVYTYIPDVSMQALNSLALLSLFNVPN